MSSNRTPRKPRKTTVIYPASLPPVPFPKKKPGYIRKGAPKGTSRKIPVTYKPRYNSYSNTYQTPPRFVGPRPRPRPKAGGGPRDPSRSQLIDVIRQQALQQAQQQYQPQIRPQSSSGQRTDFDRDLMRAGQVMALTNAGAKMAGSAYDAIAPAAGAAFDDLLMEMLGGLFIAL